MPSQIDQQSTQDDSWLTCLTTFLDSDKPSAPLAIQSTKTKQESFLEMIDRRLESFEYHESLQEHEWTIVSEELGMRSREEEDIATAITLSLGKPGRSTTSSVLSPRPQKPKKRKTASSFSSLQQPLRDMRKRRHTLKASISKSN
ncbi:hypothetical protein AAF712_011414 [Marasmius tenuissimus]|uniref:Uncharacterized protein n=1 Tax=Marasmius tenuissimus TaxID=585030 RepID=A0ABR2ZL77_9AGAR